MSQQPYFITGANGSGKVYPRLEIRDLVKKPEQFTLFILAWINIRNPNYEPVAAQHVQIGGIHGLPYTAWPGDPAGAPDTDAPWQGYCNHASVLFPTWHRPYVLALEQSISQEAQKVLKELNVDPNSAAKWEQAAEELRFPFWDWTSPETGTEGLPTIFYDKTLSLYMPDGTYKQVDNILESYEFGSTLPAGFHNVEEQNPVAGSATYNALFGEWSRTYRWPNSVATDVVEDYTQLNSTLTNTNSHKRGSYPDILSKVQQIFSYPIGDKRPHMIWDQFSNTTGQSKSTHDFKLSSLESPHNTVHLVVGGTGGDMMDNDYAGFDPIFFLHHCNVDRLLALWEYVYPEYQIGKNGYETPSGYKPFIQPDGTYAEIDDAVVNELSPLVPFRKSDNQYWTTKDTFLLEKGAFPKYYTYPPVDGVSVDKPATAAERARDLAILQKHFGYTPTVQRDNHIPIKQGLFVRDSEEKLPSNNEPVWNFRQFVVVVELVEHAFGGSHFLEVLYTAKDGTTYGVGATAVLGRNHGTQCGACRQRRLGNSKVRDSIHIPHHIIVKIITDYNLNDSQVGDAEFCDAIRNSLHAQIVTPSGTHRARAHPGGGSRQGGPHLDSAAVPKLHLASANVCAGKDINMSHPWQFYDWQDHGSFLGGEWVTQA